MKRSRPWLLSATLLLVLVACETAPQSLRDLEDRGAESLTNYWTNTQEAVRALKEWGLAGHEGWIDLLAELSIDDATEVLIVPGEEGEEDLVRKVVDPDVAKQVLVDYRTQMNGLRSHVAKFDAKWEEAGADWIDAMEIREKIREWLNRTGIRPEHIDAVSRALESELKRRR